MQPERNSDERLTVVISTRPNLAVVKALLSASGLPTEDLTERHCDHFFFAGSREAPSGVVGLETFEDVALLRSLVVAPDNRSSGLGSALVRHAEAAARANRSLTIYLWTTTAGAFFAARGYVRASREAAPPAIRATREFSGLCPASSAFMKRTL
jgi:amino-acid N-acetyltransferase